MEVAILGGGNGAYATAADLVLRGMSVRMWRRNAQQFSAVLATSVISITDRDGVHKAHISLPTTQLSEAICGAEVVIIPLPAFAQDEMVIELAPLLEDGQVILLTPGSFGAYIMANDLRKAGCTADLIFAESATLPYLTRKLGSAEVGITARATLLPFGVYPSSTASNVKDKLAQLFPGSIIVDDVLDAALLNAGPIIHPPLIILNAAALEHSSSFDIHNEGTQPCTRLVQEALDNERIMLREKLGYNGPHYPLSDYYEGREWFYENTAREHLVDSSYWREPVDLKHHRYITEDIAFGLAFMVSVADWANVDVPVARSLLSLASVIVGRDLRSDGRTLESTGLSSMEPVQVKRVLREDG